MQILSLHVLLLHILFYPIVARGQSNSQAVARLPESALIRLGTDRFKASGTGKTVRFVPGTQTFVVAGKTSSPQLYDAETGHRLRSLAYGMQGVVLHDVAPDGYVAVLSRNPEYSSTARGHQIEFRIRRGPRGRRVTWSAPVVFQPRQMALSPDRKQVLLTTSAGRVQIRDCETAELIRETKLKFSGIQAVDWSLDGRTVAIAGRSGLLLWPVRETNSFPRTVIGFAQRVQTIAFSNNGRLLAASEQSDPAVHLFDCESRQLIRSIHPSDSKVGHDSLCFSKDDRRLYVPNPAHHTIDEFDVRTGELMRRLRSSIGVTSVDVNSLGTRMVGVGVEQSISVWNLPDGDELTVERPGHEVVPHLVVISDNNRDLFSIDVSGRLNHWDGTTGELKKSLDVRTEDSRSVNVAAMDVSGDNRLLAALCSDGSLRVWDMGSGEQIARHDGHGSSDVMKLRFLPGDREIVSGSADDGIKLTTINAEQRWLANLHQDLSQQDLAGAGVNLMRWSTGVRDDEQSVGPLIYQPGQLDQAFVLPFKRNFVDFRQTAEHTITITRVRQGHQNMMRLSRYTNDDRTQALLTEDLSAGWALLNNDGSVCVNVSPKYRDHRRVANEAVFYTHHPDQSGFSKRSVTLPDSVRHAFASPDGNLLATVLDDTTILLFDQSAAE